LPPRQSTAVGQGPVSGIKPIDTTGIARVEGGTVFSGADETIQSTVPAATPAVEPGPDLSDDDFERDLKLKQAISSKTLRPVEAVTGKTYTAVGCAGRKEGRVSFTFERAYIGDFEYRGIVERGVYVVISIALHDCGDHPDVRLIQVLRDTTKTDGNVVAADPITATRRNRAGWDDDNARSQGWRVDALENKRTPFATRNDARGFVGNDGSSTRPARLRDAPGESAVVVSFGKEFRTCAVSYAGGFGTVLACIEWGYYVNEAGEISMVPSQPIAVAGELPEVKDAADRFDNIPDDDKANLTK
jgi:hypothetical protein